MLRIVGIALAAATLAATGAFAEDLKVGVVLPLTGGLAPVGKQGQAGIKMYMDKNGGTLAGEKIDLIIKDDAGGPGKSKQVGQERNVKEKDAVVRSGGAPRAHVQ